MVDVIAADRSLFLKKQIIHQQQHQQSRVDDAVHIDGNVKVLNEVLFEAELMCCRFSPLGKLLAIGLANGSIKVYSMESKTIVYNIPCPAGSKNLPVTCIRWKPINNPEQRQYGNIILATYASGDVRRWHVSSGQCLHANVESAQLLGCSYNASGRHSVVSDSDGKINYYDEESGVKIRVLQPSTNFGVMDGHMMRVFVVQYNPHNDHVFVSGGWDDTIQWWDTRIGGKHSIKKIFGPHICGEGLDIEPNTMLMVAASWRKENNLQVFDFGTGKEITSLKGEASSNSMLYCAQWKDRDSVICGGSHSNLMRLIDLKSTQTIGRVSQLPGAVYSIDHNHFGTRPTMACCTDKRLLLVEDTL